MHANGNYNILHPQRLVLFVHTVLKYLPIFALTQDSRNLSLRILQLRCADDRRYLCIGIWHIHCPLSIVN
jgi:hypothetical protein